MILRTVFETGILHGDFDIKDLSTILPNCHGLVGGVMLDPQYRDHKHVQGASNALFWARKVVLGL